MNRIKSIAVAYCSPTVRCLAILSSIIFVTAFAAIALHGQSPDGCPQETVRGVVVNSVTNKPISRALVFSGDNRYAMLTDQQGRFEFKMPPQNEDSRGAISSLSNGTLSLYGGAFFAARKPGFQPSMIPPSPSANCELTLRLTPEAMVVGHVNASGGDSAANVNVLLLHKDIQEGTARWFNQGAASTNSKGEFRFADLPAGDYKVMTQEWIDRDPASDGPHQQHFGYPPAYYPNAPGYASAGILHLAAGETRQADLSLSRQPYYPVRIELANADRGAGLNVEVTLAGGAETGTEWVPSGFALGYNPRQQRVEGELPNGTYTVEATTYGPDPSTGLSGSVTVTVAGAAAAAPRLTLVRSPSIEVVMKDQHTSSAGNEGRIYSGPPDPARYIADVSLMPERQGQRGAGLPPSKAPASSSAMIENVMPGRYVVRAYSYLGYIASITSGITDLRHERLTVGASGVTAPIEVVVRNDYAVLEGTVRKASGEENHAVHTGFEPSAFIYCIPLPDSDGQYTESAAMAENKFSLPNLVPGTYRILAFDHQQQLEYKNPEAMRAYESLGKVIAATAGQTQQVELTTIMTGRE